MFAAAGEKKRNLSSELSPSFSLSKSFSKPDIVLKGILAIQAPAYTNEKKANEDIQELSLHLSRLAPNIMAGFPLIVLVDDSEFTARNLNNFLWVTFTRSNPSHDIHGIDEFIQYKHWGCRGSLIIDARIKPHHRRLH